jgi:hypothetical protein
MWCNACGLENVLLFSYDGIVTVCCIHILSWLVLTVRFGALLVLYFCVNHLKLAILEKQYKLLCGSHYWRHISVDLCMICLFSLLYVIFLSEKLHTWLTRNILCYTQCIDKFTWFHNASILICTLFMDQVHILMKDGLWILSLFLLLWWHIAVLLPFWYIRIHAAS